MNINHFPPSFDGLIVAAYSMSTFGNLVFSPSATNVTSSRLDRPLSFCPSIVGVSWIMFVSDFDRHGEAYIRCHRLLLEARPALACPSARIIPMHSSRPHTVAASPLGHETHSNAKEQHTLVPRSCTIPHSSPSTHETPSAFTRESRNSLA